MAIERKDAMERACCVCGGRHMVSVSDPPKCMSCVGNRPQIEIDLATERWERRAEREARLTETIGLRNEVARLERELARAREGALSTREAAIEAHNEELQRALANRKAEP